MKDQIPVLAELSRSDLECARLRDSADSIPRELAKHEADLKVHQRALAEQERRLEDLERERRGLEHDAQAARERRRELEQKQFRIKNNVEYQAIMREMEDLRRRAGELDEEALKILAEEEETQRQVEQSRELIGQEERRLAGIRERLQSELADYQQQLNRALESREALVARLAPQLRSRYERIRRSKGDMAVVGVDHGACMGCGYQLPPQKTAEVHKGESFLVCEGCGRILVAVD